MNKKVIYFLCTGNSCRSQMAEGLARTYLHENFIIYSGGIVAHGLNEMAVQVMEEIGIDISKQLSETIDASVLEQADYVITLCGDANEKCPWTPAHKKRLHWGIDDPAQVEGTEEQKWQAFRTVRDELDQRIKIFKEEMVEKDG